MKTVIKSLSASTGYLEGTTIDFSEGLNCVIGSRGTCKSTLVETLRFVFNCDDDRVRALLAKDASNDSGIPSPKGLIRASLGDGTAKCVVVNLRENGEEEELLLERSIDSSTRVYREGVQEVGASGVFDRIEIYSQGQLEQVAENPLLRLQLIDRPNQERVNRIRGERHDIAKKLRDLGPKIKRSRSEIDAQRAEIRSLDSYRRDLDGLRANRPSLSPKLTAEREAFQKRKGILEKMNSLGRQRVEVLTKILEATEGSDKFRQGVSLLEDIDYSEAKSLGDRLLKLADLLNAIRADVEAVRDDALGPALQAIKDHFEEEDQRYFSLRREEQEVSENLRREDVLRQEIEKMTEIERKTSVNEELLLALSSERTDLRSRLDHLGDELYRLRTTEAEKINEDFGDLILLTLRQGEESAEYRALVNVLLQGSRLRNQDEVANDIARNVLPSDLIDIVESSDAARLASFLNRDLGQMTRLVSFLLDNPRLYDVEGLIFEDWLEITMYISGEPKPVNQLSKGQMATALLPLMLRSAPYPLIFDQPEDDLDNAFIFRTLIARLRELKKLRQLIFVTHNANIPVLGEANQVIVMSMKNPKRVNKPIVGGVDECREQILSLLEGGAEAFRRRQERYGELVA